MSTPILTTKLHRPTPRPNLVARPRLLERLDAGHPDGQRPGLILISAPAGFGKTTLMSEWVSAAAQRTPPVQAAWLALDEEQSNPYRFLAYLLAALQTIAPGLGDGLSSALSAPQPPPISTVLTALLNEIAAVEGDFVVVLDDYHTIEGPEVDEALAFLINHRPPQLRLALTTRADPSVPLPRLRARGQLTELRAADLRFTPAEAAAFLNQVMGLELSPAEITALETRTEGWIAGLQLAALSMRGRADVGGFIKAFAGDNRYIVDYLVEEVLQRQPAEVRRFLLQTSLLDRLTGPLCAAVTGQAEAGALLETLERGNLFIIPLDDQRQWFRYHHLFGDVLRAHLLGGHADDLPDLHRRASAWYAAHAQPAAAVRHALAAQDEERAAALIEQAWTEMDHSRQSARWLTWVRTLADTTIRARPVLCAGYAWALLDRGELEAAETWLQVAEQWQSALAKGNQPAPIVADEVEYRFLPATIASGRAYLSLAQGDVPATRRHARQALDQLPATEYVRRGSPAALLGLAAWTEGDVETAAQAMTDANASFEQADNLLYTLTGAYTLAEIQVTLGRLRQAAVTLHHALRLGERLSPGLRWGAADLHTGLGDLYREQNDWTTAQHHLRLSQELGEKAPLPRWRYRWCLARARLKQAAGDVAGALDLLAEAERHYVRGPVPDARPIAALKARLWIRQGRLPEALAWVRAQQLTPQDELSYTREFEHLTLARVLLSQGRAGGEAAGPALQTALRLLTRLCNRAGQAGRVGVEIECRVLAALTHAAAGELPAARAALDHALTLAEPEGYARVFLDEGAGLADLLADAAARGSNPSYVSRLRGGLELEPPPAAGPTAASAPTPLIEPLSERELEAVRLIAAGLSNREIAERLFLALPTIKGLNQSLFAKLQVRRRTEAVARARELGLL